MKNRYSFEIDMIILFKFLIRFVDYKIILITLIRITLILIDI